MCQGEGGVLRELKEPWLPPGFLSLLHWKRRELRVKLGLPEPAYPLGPVNNYMIQVKVNCALDISKYITDIFHC